MSHVIWNFLYKHCLYFVSACWISTQVEGGLQIILWKGLMRKDILSQNGNFLIACLTIVDKQGSFYSHVDLLWSPHYELEEKRVSIYKMYQVSAFHTYHMHNLFWIVSNDNTYQVSALHTYQMYIFFGLLLFPVTCQQHSDLVIFRLLT